MQILGSAVIVASNALSELRTPYGRDGADQMTSVITQYRTLTGLISDPKTSDEFFLQAVNAQAALSYFTSGFSKLFGPSWVRGTALAEVMATDVYGSGLGTGLLKKLPRVMRGLTYATLVWETCFPVVYLLPRPMANLAMVGVKTFHLGIAAMMELPRFFWGFAGSHGAVLHMINRPQGLDFRRQPLVPIVFGAAAGVTGVSCIHAAGERAVALQRRRGAKGTRLLATADGQIEFTFSSPGGVQVSNPGMRPVVVLEAGLGAPLESWDWVMAGLAESCDLLAYHRKGYGLSTSNMDTATVVTSLLHEVGASGPIILVGHSFGSLVNGILIRTAPSELKARILGVVVVDGTDPELLEADRANPDRRGLFLQAQLNSMFLALTGIYNFAPNAVSRQSQYAADTAFAVNQFSFTPRHIVTATREYSDIEAREVIPALQSVPLRCVISSEENEVQQEALARKIEASFTKVSGSTHRTILGERRYAVQVLAVVQSMVGKVVSREIA